MSDSKRTGSRDISELKARLGLKKGAAAGDRTSRERNGGQTGGVVAPPGLNLPPPPGAAAPQPVIPNAADDPFGAMNAMAAVGTVQRAPEIVIVNDGKPVENVGSSVDGREDRDDRDPRRADARGRRGDRQGRHRARASTTTASRTRRRSSVTRRRRRRRRRSSELERDPRRPQGEEQLQPGRRGRQGAREAGRAASTSRATSRVPREAERTRRRSRVADPRLLRRRRRDQGHARCPPQGGEVRRQGVPRRRRKAAEASSSRTDQNALPRGSVRATRWW